MRPAAFLQKVTCKIVHMNPLHHKNDGILPLVIEARIDRVVEPLLGVRPFRLRHSFGGLERIVDDDQTAAAPGKGAADDVANRDPRLVVITSISVFLEGSILVRGKVRMYHSLASTARNWLASVAESSCA